MEFDLFIKKYYDEFGPMCPFKKKDFISDEKQLLEQFKPQLIGDIELLTRFFIIDIPYLHDNLETLFTIEEIKRLKYLDKYWDIPRMDIIFTKKGRENYYIGMVGMYILTSMRNSLKDKT